MSDDDNDDDDDNALAKRRCFTQLCSDCIEIIHFVIASPFGCVRDSIDFFNFQFRF